MGELNIEDTANLVRELNFLRRQVDSEKSRLRRSNILNEKLTSIIKGLSPGVKRLQVNLHLLTTEQIKSDMQVLFRLLCTEKAYELLHFRDNGFPVVKYLPWTN